MVLAALITASTTQTAACSDCISSTTASGGCTHEICPRLPTFSISLEQAPCCRQLGPTRPDTEAGFVVPKQILNMALLEFGRNWVRHLDNVGAHNYMVAVYDEETAATMVEWGVPCLDVSDILDFEPGGGLQKNCSSCPRGFQCWRERGV